MTQQVDLPAHIRFGRMVRTPHGVARVVARTPAGEIAVSYAAKYMHTVKPEFRALIFPTNADGTPALHGPCVNTWRYRVDELMPL